MRLIVWISIRLLQVTTWVRLDPVLVQSYPTYFLKYKLKQHYLTWHYKLMFFCSLTGFDTQCW